MMCLKPVAEDQLQANSTVETPSKMKKAAKLASRTCVNEERFMSVDRVRRARRA